MTTQAEDLAAAIREVIGEAAEKVAVAITAHAIHTAPERPRTVLDGSTRWEGWPHAPTQDVKDRVLAAPQAGSGPQGTPGPRDAPEPLKGRRDGPAPWKAVREELDSHIADLTPTGAVKCDCGWTVAVFDRDAWLDHVTDAVLAALETDRHKGYIINQPQDDQ